MRTWINVHGHWEQVMAIHGPELSLPKENLVGHIIKDRLWWKPQFIIPISNAIPLPHSSSHKCPLPIVPKTLCSNSMSKHIGKYRFCGFFYISGVRVSLCASWLILGPSWNRSSALYGLRANLYTSRLILGPSWNRRGVLYGLAPKEIDNTWKVPNLSL